ncbi:FkbM family methyltransferase [Ramlibacter sp. XY19]|uniref:FkbM family methyltransferase n=1 Tax=Ramlibacter paludis TaxID=2908000 RepID=UPI0023DBEC8B|nr:FkbM family methyltransferase [Ramlibacter paludis]MCG2591239.1 FkbM family methyltransferase [Ramlibacter paludis]
MGYLVEKYTAAYFLKKDENGAAVPYGVEGIEAFQQGQLRGHDSEILEHVNFRDASVLEFGFGRGESIKYAWEHGAGGYVGVDFSEPACRIAGEFLSKYAIEGPRIVCSDALEFLRDYTTNPETAGKKFDVVMMLDFVEHVPRSELAELLRLLRGCLHDTSVVVVNTPDFLFDNDVISEGLNELGRDSSDFIDETRGMHCNRYTLDSLRRFFLALGYAAVSRGHYFVPAVAEDMDFWQGQRSYAGAWAAAQARGCRLQGAFPRETFEITHQVKEKAELHTFADGNLAGLSIYVTKSYLEYYGGGNYDSFLSGFIARQELAGKAVFDLGSFVGVNSLQLARLVGPTGRVCAFEPNPFNADRLRMNLSENPDLEARVRVFPLALSNEQGTVRFNLHRNVDAGVSSASYLQGARTTLSEETLVELGFQEMDVMTCTLDEFVRRTGIKPALLKIDIEGSEHLALLGAMATMKEAAPALMVELHSTYCAVMVLNTLDTLGYSSELLHIEEDGRCYIGASRSTGKLEDSRRRELEGVALQANVFRHELDRVRMQQDVQARQAALRDQETTAKFASLSDEIERLKAEADLQQQEKVRLDAEVARLGGEAAQLSAEASRLEAERARLEGERARLEGERARLESERVRLDEEQQVERLRLQAEASHLQAMLTAVSTERDQLAQEKSGLTTRLLEEQAATVAVNGELQVEKAIRAALEQQLQLERSAGAELARQLEQERAAASAQLEQERASGVTLGRKLEEERSVRAKLATQLEEERATGVRLAGQLEEERATAVQLAGQLQEERSAGARLAGQLKEERAAASKLAGQLKDERSARANLEQQLEKERAEATAVARQLEQERSSAAGLAADLERIRNYPLIRAGRTVRRAFLSKK